MSLWRSGAIVYGAAVLCVNYKIIDSMHNYDLMGVLFPILSFVCYVLFFYLEQLPSLNVEQLIGIFPKAFGNPNTYLALIFVVVQVYALERVLEFFVKLIEDRKK